MLPLFHVAIIKMLSKVFLKIREFSKTAEEIVEGRFNKKLPDNKEGDFYILGNQFDIMAKRLNDNLNKLREDKIFLKTIIESQQGSISVKSKEGTGTEFNITFLKTVI